jgi:hypothetical protein
MLANPIQAHPCLRDKTPAVWTLGWLGRGVLTQVTDWRTIAKYNGNNKIEGQQ